MSDREQAGFFEVDEPIEDIKAAWEDGEKGFTRNPAFSIDVSPTFLTLSNLRIEPAGPLKIQDSESVKVG